MGRGEDQISLVVADSANGKDWIPEAFDDPTEALSITDDSSDETSSDDESFDDVLSRIIRQRSNGVALYSILCISLSMALLSFLLLFQFGTKVEDRSRQAESVENSIPLYTSEGLCSTESYVKPLWQELLELQIAVIQNLLHAALFGSAALVAAIRGDTLWLFFSRNLGFYLFPVTFFSFIHDLEAILWSSHDNVEGFQFRLFLSFFMAASSGVAFVKNEATCQVVRRMVVQRVNSQAEIPTSDTTSTNYSPFLARNAADMKKANVIFYGALFAQASNVLYAIVTATQWFALNVECNDSTNPGQRRIEGMTMAEDENTSGENLRMFEMAYSMAAHQSYLLALIMLASTYPRHFACVGGAMLTSGWRLLVATGSLRHIYLHWNGAPRDSFSLLYTSLEMIAMLPVFVAALVLMRDICRAEGKGSGYKPVGSVENNLEEAALNDLVEESEENEFVETRFHCPTLSQIATSDRYSSRQNWGARLLCVGSAALLLEFTVECVATLRQHFIGTGMAHDVWKWGMHVCSIYLFCAIMSVETPSIYSRTRLLLAAACPVGSLVGLWQLWTLLQYAEDGTDDPWTLLVACLLGVRILCGLTQTLGLIILQDTEPVTNVVSDYCKVPDHELASSQRRAKFALYKLYLPTFVAFIVGVALMSNCSEPMISTMIPSESCSVTRMDFVLDQNWPGLGLFFHFGMLIVVGAVDGLSTGSPSYRPSLAIARLFAGHVTCLIFVSFAWDVLQTDGWDVLSLPDVIQRMVLFLWMVASGYLFVCLHRHWKLRVLPM
jgi:hypothetical protein